MNLYSDIKNCTLCADKLAHKPNPVMQFSENSKIVIVGQAPGVKVHNSGIPWHDQSGKRLRQWLNVSKDVFYNTDNFAIVPMGFCYPGKGKSGDLPPLKICAKTWHSKVFKQFTNKPLVLLIGAYAQNYYLVKDGKNLTERVLHAEEYLPKYFPLPHPSPRNEFWIKKNPWFETDVVPKLQQLINQGLYK